MDKVLSKEEIREKHLYKNGLSVNKSKVGYAIQKSAYDAMDEFAQQQSISFAKWVTGTINPIYTCNGNGAWEVVKPSPTPQPKEFISDEKLYELYLQSIK